MLNVNKEQEAFGQLCSYFMKLELHNFFYIIWKMDHYRIDPVYVFKYIYFFHTFIKF